MRLSKTTSFLILAILLFTDFVALAQSPAPGSTGEYIVKFGLIAKLYALASIDLYATLFYTGLAIHYGWDDNVPTYLEFLSKPGNIKLFGFIFIVEFIVEKIPGIGSAWNFGNAFVKIIVMIVFTIMLIFNPNYEINFLTVVVCIAIAIFVSVIDGKVMVLVGAIPGVSAVVTIIEDIVIIGALYMLFS